MTSFDTYVFVLCTIVFTLLTSMFTYLIYSLTKQELELIRGGHRDEQIREEFEKKNSSGYRAITWVSRVLSLLLCLAFAAVFASALYIRANDDRPANGIPSIKVVKSTSMAEKNEKNKYLFENQLDNQIQMFDVVICNHLPAEEDLKLYDIVVYKQDDMYVIHRIVGIEEPNEKHPNERHFLLQGDAVKSPDVFPVLYSQMQGIYEGTRFAYVGSFIMFLQSPAGWLCMLLVIFAMIATPIAEKILNDAKKEQIGYEDASFLAPIKGARKAPVFGGQGMHTYYNRPGSPFSQPMQRQDQANPYRHSQSIKDINSILKNLKR